MKKIGRPKHSGIKEGRKLEHSNFFITINTQKKIDSLDDPEGFQERFENVLRDLFQNETYQDELIVFKNPDDAPHMEELITDIFTSGRMEIGGIQRKLHGHILYEIHHYSRLHLSFDFIKDFVKAEMGIEEDIHLYIKLVHNHRKMSETERVQMYSEKGEKRIF